MEHIKLGKGMHGLRKVYTGQREEGKEVNEGLRDMHWDGGGERIAHM
jgi:hypothetical protein